MGEIEAQQQRLDWLNGEGLEVSADATPIDFLCAVYRDPRQPMSRRLKAAIEAAPYAHPKLAVTAFIDGADFAHRLERAVERSQPKLIEAKAEPTRKVIEAQPLLSDQSGPISSRTTSCGKSTSVSSLFKSTGNMFNAETTARIMCRALLR